jgi:hypothetical protein
MFLYYWQRSQYQQSQSEYHLARKDVLEVRDYLLESEYQLAMLKSQYQQLQTQRVMEMEKEKAVMEWDLKK